MSATFEYSILAIFDSQERIQGTGFLVTNNLAVTCTHVVRSCKRNPGEQIQLRFHGKEKSYSATVSSRYWNEDQDVAFLHIPEDVAANLEPLPLGQSTGSVGHHVKCFGYPDTGTRGLWAAGTVRGPIQDQGGRELLQIDSSEITQGFSGAPVSDERTYRVIGMVTAVASKDRMGRLGQVAYSTPTEILRIIFPELVISDICPYRSLDAFTEADAEFFFGRKRVVDRLLDNLRRELRFLAVLGPSGCGKSSVVHAGLLPTLRQGMIPGSNRWGLVTTRPADNPFEQLSAQGLTIVADSLTDAAQTWLECHPEHERLVLVIDQFEELLVTCPERLRQQFVIQLTCLLDSPLSISVILVMRDDFYALLSKQTPDLLRWVERGLVNVPLELSMEELTSIILEPAEAVGLRFGPGLVDEIVEDVIGTHQRGTEGRVGYSTILPLLEFALTQLWERREDGLLTHKAYSDIGGVTGGLPQWADRAFHTLSDNQRAFARRILTDLVYLSDGDRSLPYSRRRPLSSLYRNKEEQTLMLPVLQQLTEARLVVTSRDLQKDQENVELVHEALLREWQLLRDWLQDDRRFLMWRQEIEKRALAWVETNPEDQNQRDEGKLLRGGDLVIAGDWLARRSSDLSPGHCEYIQASINLREMEIAEQGAQRQRELEQAQRLARTQRQRSLALTIGFVIAAILSIIAFSFYRQSNQNLSSANVANTQSAANAATAVAERNIAETAQVNAQEKAVEAEKQSRIAFVRQLAAQSISQRIDHLNLSYLLSLEVLYHAEDAGIPSEGQSSILSALVDQTSLIAFLNGHNDWVFSVKFSPDGKLLASGSRDGTIILWDVDSQKQVRKINTKQGIVYGTAFSPDGKIIASSGSDNSIVLWDVNSGEQLGSPLIGHSKIVCCVAFSSNGKTLASLGSDGRVILWDVTSQQSLGELLSGMGPWVNSIAFSPDDRLLAIGTNYQDLYLYDMNEHQFDTLSGHQHIVNSVAFSPDGKILASGSDDKSIILWDMDTYKQIGTPLTGHTSGVLSVAFSPDGKRLISGSMDKNIILWNVDNQQAIGTPLSGHTDNIWSVDFSSDGKTIAAGSGDISVSLWDVNRRQRLGIQLMGNTKEVYSVAFNPDGTLLASGSWDSSVRLWDVLNQKLLAVPLITGISKGINAIAFSPDGKTLAFGGYDNVVVLWDIQSGIPFTLPMETDQYYIYDLAFSPDGKILAISKSDTSIILWDLTTHKQLGSPLITSMDGGFFCCPAVGAAIAFSPDGKILASGSGFTDGIIVLWDVKTFQQLGTQLIGHTGPVYSVAFSPDGKTLASASYDQTIILWDIDTQRMLGKPLTGHTSVVYNVVFSPNGRTLASGGGDNNIILWDVASHSPLGEPLTGHTGSVISLAFSPDGKILASGSEDTNIIIWDIDPDSWIERLCQISGRNLTSVEWAKYFPDEEYRITCPQWPSGE